MLRVVVLALLCAVSGDIFGQNSNNILFSLYYNIREKELNHSQLEKIDSLLTEIPAINNSKVIIKGYADFLGEEEYNKVLSAQRSQKVKSYLLEKGLKEDRIIICEGKGEVSSKAPSKTESGNKTDRRVDIIIKPANDNNSLAQLEDMKAGESIILKNLNFHPGRHTIRIESIPELQKLLYKLKENPTLKIEIQGHICCEVNLPDGYDFDSGNYNLSVNRAKFVYEYLVRYGINPSRLRYTGMGRSKPLITEELTEQDRDKNRRVEIKILEG